MSSYCGRWVNNSVYEMDKNGEIVLEGEIACSKKEPERIFKDRKPITVAMGTDTHSPCTSRMLEEWGHSVLVGNAGKLRWPPRSKPWKQTEETLRGTIPRNGKPAHDFGRWPHHISGLCPDPRATPDASPKAATCQSTSALCHDATNRATSTNNCPSPKPTTATPICRTSGVDT